MQKLIQLNKIHIYFWITSLLIILIGLKDINNPDATLDFNIHDTYFVIDYFYAATLISSVYFLLGLGYWIINKFNGKLFRILSLIHLIVSIGSFLIYWIVLLLIKSFYTEEELFLSTIDWMDNTVLLILISNIIAQPLYIINIITSLIRKLNTTK